MATHKAFGMGVHRFHFPRNNQALATLLTNLASARKLGIPFFLQITDKAFCIPPGEEVLVARVLPDVAGFGKLLDYVVPPLLARETRVGTVVRVPLQGRRVRGWVVAFPVGASLRVSSCAP